MRNRSRISLYNIQFIYQQIESGRLVVPAFQRNFAWSRDHVRNLLESIYRGFPIGTILVLEASPSNMPFRTIGSAKPNTQNNIISAGHTMLWYVLDGSQRLEAMYKVFFGNENDLDFYFDLESERFLYKRSSKENTKLIRLRDLFSPESFSKLLFPLLNDEDSANLIDRFNDLHATFRNYELVFQILIDMSLDEAIEVFMRTNVAGRSLTKSDLERLKKTES